MYGKIAYGFWKKKSTTVSSLCSLSCKKKWKKLASSSIKQSVKNQKQCIHPKILLLCQKVCVKRHQHQFTVVLNNWTFRRHHWDKFGIKTLVWCHTKFNWFKIWSQWVFASLCGLAIDLQKMPILAKKEVIVSDEAHFELGGYVNKQNYCIWDTENPHAYIEKPKHTKQVTVWCWFWSIFLRKWA